MKVWQLDEQAETNYLYHGTGIISMGFILNSNVLHKGTYWNRDNEPDGARLSRDPRAAAEFSHDAEYQRGGLLCFDRRKLMYNHKVVPYRDVDVMGQFWDTNEAEEVVIGPIKGVDKYLVSVIVNPEWIRELVSDLKDPKESSEMYYFFREMFGMKNEMIDLSVRTLANYPINKVVPRGVPSLDMIPPNAVDKFA